MIQKVDSLITSETVINMLVNDDRTKYVNGTIECYQNGREQGHIIWGIDGKDVLTSYYICEARASDSITIYKGRYEMQSISEDAYNNKHSFGRDFHKAVEWLINDILNH